MFRRPFANPAYIRFPVVLPVFTLSVFMILTASGCGSGEDGGGDDKVDTGVYSAYVNVSGLEGTGLIVIANANETAIDKNGRALLLGDLKSGDTLKVSVGQQPHQLNQTCLFKFESEYSITSENLELSLDCQTNQYNVVVNVLVPVTDKEVAIIKTDLSSNKEERIAVKQSGEVGFIQKQSDGSGFTLKLESPVEMDCGFNDTRVEDGVLTAGAKIDGHDHDLFVATCVNTYALDVQVDMVSGNGLQVTLLETGEVLSLSMDSRLASFSRRFKAAQPFSVFVSSQPINQAGVQSVSCYAGQAKLGGGIFQYQFSDQDELVNIHCADAVQVQFSIEGLFHWPLSVVLKNISGEQMVKALPADGVAQQLVFDVPVPLGSEIDLSLIIPAEGPYRNCGLVQDESFAGANKAASIVCDDNTSHRYAAAPLWNTYVRVDDVGKACDGDGLNYYEDCIHGGESLAWSSPSFTSCDGLTVSDALGVFDWVCQVADDGSYINVFSNGLKEGKNLSDLLDWTIQDPQWRTNNVRISSQAAGVVENPQSIFWENVVLDGSDPNTVGQYNFPAGIYVVRSTAAPVSNKNISIASDSVSIVVEPGFVFSAQDSLANVNVIESRPGSGQRRRFVWIEGDVNAYNNKSGITIERTDFSVLRNIGVSNAGYYNPDTNTRPPTRQGVVLDRSNANKLTGVKTFHTSEEGVALLASVNNELRKVDIVSSGTGGILLEQNVVIQNGFENIVSSSGNKFNGVRIHDIAGDGIFIWKKGSNNTFYDVMISEVGNRGIVLDDSYSNIFQKILFAGVQSSAILVTAGSKGNVFNGLTASHVVSNMVLLFSSNNIVMNGRFVESMDYKFSNYYANEAIDQSSGSANLVVDIAVKNVGKVFQGDAGNIYMGEIRLAGDQDFLCGADKNTSSSCAGAYAGATVAGGVLNDAVGRVDYQPPVASNFQSVPSPYFNVNVSPSAFLYSDLVVLPDRYGDIGSLFGWLSVGEERAQNVPAGVLVFQNIHCFNNYIAIDVFGPGHYCYQYDFSLANGGAELDMPTADDFISINHEGKEKPVLRHALELRGDGDGLCTFGEACLYTPYFGAYQGRGVLVESGQVDDGAHAPIALYSYEQR